MKQFEKFATTRLKHLKSLLRDYATIQDPDTLHSIRVEIKKLKAILQVIGGSVRKFRPHKNFLPFRKIFRMAGNIREPEVISQLLLKHDIIGVSPEFLPGEKESQERFIDDLPVFLKEIKKSEKKISKVAGKVKKEDLTKFMEKRMAEVKRSLYPVVSEQVLHKTRKRAKNILYLSAVNKFPGKRYRKFLEDFETKAGELHDKQTLLVLKDIPDANKKPLQALIQGDIKSIEKLASRFYE